MDRIEECFGKIQESIQTINHNSTTTSAAMNRIADAIDKIQESTASHSAQNSAEHIAVSDKLDKTISMQFKIIIALIVIVGGLVGIKLAFPGV